MYMRAIKLSINDISLMQLSDSFFPTGFYTTSNGLETLFFEGKIKKTGTRKGIHKDLSSSTNRTH